MEPVKKVAPSSQIEQNGVSDGRECCRISVSKLSHQSTLAPKLQRNHPWSLVWIHPRRILTPALTGLTVQVVMPGSGTGRARPLDS